MHVCLVTGDDWISAGLVVLGPREPSLHAEKAQGRAGLGLYVAGAR